MGTKTMLLQTVQHGWQTLNFAPGAPYLKQLIRKCLQLLQRTIHVHTFGVYTVMSRCTRKHGFN